MKRWFLLLVVLGSIFGLCQDVYADLMIPANYFHESLDLAGIRLTATADNYSSETTLAYFNGHLRQGIDGRYYQLLNSILNFWTFQENPSNFYFSALYDFSILSKEDYIPDFNIGMNQGSYFNAFGVFLSSNLNVRNYTVWQKNPDDPESWLPVVTDSPEISFSLYLRPAQIETIQLNVNTWEWNENNFLTILFDGHGHFVAATEAEANALGSLFVVPEPATVFLLGLGGLLLKRKR